MAKKLTQREKALALAAVVKNSGADAAAQLAQQYKQQEEKSLQQAIRAAQPVPELTPVQPAKQQTNWYDGLFGNSAAGASAPAVSTGQDNILNTLFTAQAMQDAATLQAHKDLSAAARMGGEYFTAGAKSGLEGLLQGGMAAGDLLQQQQAERLAQQYQGLAALPVLGDKAKQAAQNQQSFARQATEETNRQILAQKQKTDARQQALEQKYADRTGLANDAVKMAAGGIGNMVPYLAAGTVGNLMGLGGLGMAAMGLQTAGGGMADALADGATTEQARANALLQAAAAMGTEKLMGGIPGLAKAGGLADDAVNALAGKLGGKTAQGAAKWGMNAVGEGVEEVAEEALNELAARLTYGKQGSIEQTVRGEKALPELAAEYGQTFAGGALIGGVLDAAGNAVRGGFNWWDGLFGESVPQAAQNPNLQANAKAEQTSPKSEQTSPKSEQTSPIKAGKATVIKSPYSGKGSTPQYTDAVQREKPSFTAENVQAVTQKIAQAQGSGEGFKKALTNLCNEAYGALFGGRRVSVRGLSIDGAPYDVTLNSNVIRKVISDKNLSAEKIAILGNIQNVVENSEYLGSGNFIAKEGSRKVAERYDYFETSVVIDGVPYTVAFDVEVQPGTNNYRTHRVINDISLNVSNQRADTSPAQAAWFEHSSLSKPTVTQPEPTVNPNSVDASTVNTVLQSAAKTPVDRRPRHFDQAQVDSDVLDWKKTKTEATGEKDVLNSLFEGGPKPAGQPVEERKTGGQSRVLGLETDRAWRTQQLAKELRSEWPSRVSQAEMVELLEGVYGQFRTEASEETRRQIAKQAAENILTHSTRQNRELWEQYPELHGFKVQVAKGSDLMNELQYAYGSYAEAKKDLAAHGVQLQQVPEGTKTHLDTDLMELADLYPEFFNAWDNDPLAMVRQMADAYDAIRPRMENQYGESYDDAVQELTSAIYHGAARVEPPQTGAPQRTAEQEAASADANSWADELFPPVTGAPQMPTAREVIDQRNQARATAQEDFAATAQPPENAARVVNTANEPPSELREVKEIREEGVNMALVDEVTVDEGAYFADKRPYFTDTDRAMEQIAPSNTPAGKYMKRNLLEPFKQAKRAYAKNLTTNVREFGRKMKELGILPGSKQDKELQWFREGVRWVRAEGAAKAEARKYTLADLQADDPENWKNIVEANKLYGQWTDAYFERVNQTQQMIYPMAQADVEENIRKMEEQADGALYQRKALEEQLGFYTDAEVNLTKALMNEVREAEAAKARAESYLNRAKEAGKETARAEKSLQQAETRLQRAQKAVAQHPELEDVVNLFRQMDVLQKREKSTRQMAQNLRTGLENGDALRNKRLPYKDNYVPHLKDSVTGLKQLKNILTASDYQIDPHLVGTSEWTKPKSRWAGFMQRRSGEVPYNEGAVQNMLVQMRNYEYKIAFDPIIARSRSIISSLAEATEQSRNANGAIQWLSEWTNDLAGKTSFIDRPIMNVAGRQNMDFLRWVNGRVKSNAVMGNLRSALKQVSNLPNGIGYVKNPKDLAAGSKAFAASHLPGTAGDAARAKLDESAFLTERYGISDVYNEFETALKDKPAQFAAKLMEFGDKAVAEYIYLAAYEQGVRLGETSPADYADELCRKTVGGRGVGEQPLILKSQTVNLLAPFQTEVLNSYNAMRERVGHKDAKGIVLTIVATALVSAALGSDAGWNPLGDLLDALKGAEEDDTAADVAMQAGKNLAGGAAANMPFAEQLISMAMDDQTSEALFGDDDPTRYGTANMGLAALVEPTADLLTAMLDPDKKVTDVDLVGTWGANLALPFGGAQARRTRDALIDAGVLAEGVFGTTYPAAFAAEKPIAGHYTSSGKLMYPVDSGNPWEVGLAALFGSGATEYGKANNGEYMSENQTELYKDAVRSGMDEKEAYNALNGLFAVESSKDAEGETIDNSLFFNRVDYINSLDVSRDQKANLIYNYMGDTRRGYTDAAVATGLSKTDACETLVTMERIRDGIKEGGLKLQGQMDYLNARGFANDQKAVLLYNYLSDTKQKHCDAAVSAGADRWQAVQFMVFCANTTTDKDANGKTINGSRKKKIEAELDRLRVSGNLREIYLKAAEY